jgi:hypothetical protein
MAFGINEFTSQINKHGIAKPAHFSVLITGPISDGRRAFPLRIESVSIPGRNLITLDQNYYGPPRQIPYRFMVQPVTLTIILSQDMYEREYFMRWQDSIIGSSRKYGDGTPGSYDAGFYDDYIGNIEIKQYSESPSSQGRTGNNDLLSTVKEVAAIGGIDTSIFTAPLGFQIPGLGGPADGDIKEATMISLKEAYPIAVNDIQMNWADDGYARLNVEIRYHHMEEKNESFGAGADNNNGFLNQLRSGVQAFQKFTPIFSAVKNLGIVGATRATLEQSGQSIITQGRAVKATLPF